MTALGAFLIAHGSALILPLSVIEGPVVSVVTGFIAAQGYVYWYWALLLLICGDVIGDSIYYWMGRTGGAPLRVLGRLAGVRGGPSGALQHELAGNSTKMLLIGKWTHSIGVLVLIGSGMLRLPLRRFLFVNLLATVPKSAALFALGYFVSDRIPFLEQHAVIGTVALCIAGAASVALVLRRTGSFWVQR